MENEFIIKSIDIDIVIIEINSIKNIIVRVI